MQDIEFRVLGPLEIIGEMGPVGILAPRQQTVLAMLLLDANHLVPTERLITAVWNDEPPRTARDQIQICISALRRKLKNGGIREVIATQAPGYRLLVNERQLDLISFDRLVQDGRALRREEHLAEAVEAYQEALALWRGDLLEGVNSELVQNAGVRLIKRRLDAHEECIGARLQRGDHHGLIDELTELVATYPLREHFHAQLMTVLYQTGRRAEALQVYKTARQILVEELGLDPGQELRLLEQRILAGELTMTSKPVLPAVGMPGPSAAVIPRQLPPDISEFKYRSGLIGKIRAILNLAAEGSNTGVRIVTLAGQSGAGKTALAVHIAHSLTDGFPDGQLYAKLDGRQTSPVPPGRALERFLRALGVPAAVIPEELEERATMYRSLMSRRRMLVLLDDAADEEQVRPLLPAGSCCAVLVTSEARIVSLPGVPCFEVGMLDCEDAVDLLASRSGNQRICAELDSARQLAVLCGGLPRALEIVAARLAARPHWTLAQLLKLMESADHPLDELVYGGLAMRDDFARTYKRLNPEAKRLFRRLGMLAPYEFAGWVTGPLLGGARQDTVDPMESLLEVHLLEFDRTGESSVSFRMHHLTREFARERLFLEDSAGDRTESLRRLLGSWLYILEEANYRKYGGYHRTVPTEAARWPLPKYVVDGLLADPANWFRHELPALVAVVRQACDAGEHELCWKLTVAASKLFDDISHLTEWRTTHEIALVATRALSNRRGEEEIVNSLHSLRMLEGQSRDSEGWLAALAQLAEHLGTVSGRPATSRNLAILGSIRSRLADVCEDYDRSVEELRSQESSFGSVPISVARSDIVGFPKAALRLAGRPGTRQGQRHLPVVGR